MTPLGNLSLDELRSEVSRGEIDTLLVAFPDLYGRLLGKRFAASFFLDSVAESGTHVCDYLLACDMEMDPVPGYAFTSWESGYGDLHLAPDLATLRRAAWIPKSALVLGVLTSDATRAPVEVAPRRMLQRQVERASAMGYRVTAGLEIELYLFDETFASAKEKRYHDLNTAGTYVEDYHLFQGTKHEPLVGAIRRGLESSGVPIETSKGEWGPGQHEINLRCSDALEQADRAAIYKHAAKEIAWSQGKALTFMAKWDETQAGSGMHVHLSLQRIDDGAPVFPGDDAIGPIRASETFRHFLGGWMARAAEYTPFFAPNVSSYKRFQAGSFAPTAIAWSRDNRTAGFRVVGQGASLRVECRIPGADANPYLVLAASLGAGLDGIERAMEPPPPFAGDAYAARDLPRVPGTLRDAVDELERSAAARETFGAEVVEHYLHFFRTEQRKFDEVVTCWERERFFERV